jgi:hypothetical protein
MNLLLDGIEALIHFQRQIEESTLKIRHWIRYGKERIVVLGSGGAGKTTLAKILSGETPSAGDDYKESINTEAFSYQGRLFGSLIVAPGQRRRREEHWPRLRQQIAEGQISGIIFVTAAGYNSLRAIEPDEHELFTSKMSMNQFMKKYCEANIKIDVEILRNELIQCVSDAPRRIWFVTLVLKKDLWWPDEKRVMKIYQTGPYAKALIDIAKKRGQKEFVHEYVSASLLIENLVSRKGTVLANTAEGFDSVKQLESLRDLTRAVSELIMDREIQEA